MVDRPVFHHLACRLFEVEANALYRARWSFFFMHRQKMVDYFLTEATSLKPRRAFRIGNEMKNQKGYQDMVTQDVFGTDAVRGEDD